MKCMRLLIHITIMLSFAKMHSHHHAYICHESLSRSGEKKVITFARIRCCVTRSVFSKILVISLSCSPIFFFHQENCCEAPLGQSEKNNISAYLVYFIFQNIFPAKFRECSGRKFWPTSLYVSCFIVATQSRFGNQQQRARIRICISASLSCL